MKESTDPDSATPMAFLEPPGTATVPIRRIQWYTFRKKIKRSAAEILDRSTFLRDGQQRSLREGMEERCAPASVETGEQHWEKARRQWTRGFPVRTEEEKRRDPLTIQLEKTSTERLVRYYEDVINSRGPFQKPVRLSHLIPILVAGWKNAGLWPTADSLREAILEKGLNPNDYDLGVHLSSVVDSDAPPEKEANLAVNKILAKQNVGKRI